MPFQLSPGVVVVEKDLSGIVPSVATSIGGFVGNFHWGPVDHITTLSNEAQLVSTFGRPSDTTFGSFFSAANFLSYSNNLKVVRVVNSAARNAATGGAGVLIKNFQDWETNYSSGEGAVGKFAARYPGLLGNSLGVSVIDGSNTWSSWAYSGSFDAEPGTTSYTETLGGTADEMHIVVVDEDGAWTGTPGTILEKFAHVSKAQDAKYSDGTSAYYVNVLANTSKYILWMDHQASSNWGSDAAGTTFADNSSSALASLAGGVEGTATDGNLETGWDLFANTELVDVNLLFTGNNSLTVAGYIVDLATTRMDCVAFVSPLYESQTSEDVLTDCTETLNKNSSYGIMDSGWKYQYDKYNDRYRWVALNADVAGLCARTDAIADPWFSPGGLNRGQIKNVVKLSWSPDKTSRDELYKKGVNPVVTFPGEGTVLFGDKTLLKKPSAFDRINVRRLFIVLEKAIATAGKYQLFEFNDTFTRSQFRNLVEPFLRDVKGRRGIYDFRVVCDETNNTGEVIDRNEFVADIFIKPARSINYMTLNFVATRTGVSFNEVAGA